MKRALPYGLTFFASVCIMILELVASRLVAKHVGSSLSVWTSVIGIILGGICLGNVLGGKLADAKAPRKVVGPLFGLGALLTISVLWVNGLVGQAPWLDDMAWQLRTVVVVTVVFLVPATLLGMIGPVNAKIAVQEARRAGTAMGDIYSLGALGSILGTFLAGFYLMYYAGISTIVNLIAAALMIPAAFLIGGGLVTVMGLTSVVLLGVGAGVSLAQLNGVALPLEVPHLVVDGAELNLATLGGHAVALIVGLISLIQIIAAPTPAAYAAQLRAQAIEAGVEPEPIDSTLADEELLNQPELRGQVVGGSMELSGDLGMKSGPPPVKLGDLAALSFVASFAFMAFEMVAGRMTQRHLGSSIYTWTSIIGVLLAGLSLGNWLGGKLADRISRESIAGWLLALGSALVLTVVLLDSPPLWLYEKIRKTFPQVGWSDTPSSLMRLPIQLTTVPGTEIPLAWQYRILGVVTLVFFLPSVMLGTISPVCAKLAVDRAKGSGRTGRSIGAVYAWGMVGSIVGTFLTGFFLIDWMGTRGVMLLLAALMALWGTIMGGLTQAVWSGVPIGLFLIAILPYEPITKQAVSWGLREPRGFIQLGLDDDQLEQLRANFRQQVEEYDPADPKSVRPVADPELINDRFYVDQKTGKPVLTQGSNDSKAYVDESAYYYIKVDSEVQQDGAVFRTLVLDNLIHGYYKLDHPEHLEYDYEFLYAQIAHRALEAKAKAARIDPSNSAAFKDLESRALYLGGGAYTFPRYMRHHYPRIEADIAEIDPAVTKANRLALGLSQADEDHIKTIFGDARQYVEKNKGRNDLKYDLIFGDAFNDFSVPWHLTTREFNEKLAQMMSDDGIYMINIIDIFHSDQLAVLDALTQRLREIAQKAVAKISSPEQAQDPLVLNRDKNDRRWARLVADDLMSECRQLASDAAVGQALNQIPDGQSLSEERRQRIRRDAADDLDQVFAQLRFLAQSKAQLDTFDPLEFPSNPQSEEVQPLLEVVRASLDRRTDSMFDQGVPTEDWRSRRLLMVEVFKALLASVPSLEAELPRLKAKALREAATKGGFLSSWVRTARLTFPHLAVFGTHSRPGVGLRETFVVVASKRPLDLEDLGRRTNDPKFNQGGEPFEPQPYDQATLDALDRRAAGIILTDDYAPVENLLAPTAASRGD